MITAVCKAGTIRRDKRASSALDDGNLAASCK